ncbi:MAG: hypothetical protein AAGJ79_09245, partial [Verrucomicrobiota bacterium]
VVVYRIAESYQALEDAVPGWERGLLPDPSSKTSSRFTTLAGQEAYELTGKTESDGKEFELHAFLLLVDGITYSIGASLYADHPNSDFTKQFFESFRLVR